MAGRREVPVDPQDGPVAEFAYGLRKLRTEAGGPTYRELARTAGYSVSTLAQAAAGRDLPSLKVALAYARACGGDAGEWEARWRSAAAAVRECAADAVEEAAPYRGLARYETSDSGAFFGRDRVTGDVLGLLARRRLAMVFGPSGSGKTSLLRAAVIPALRGESTRPRPEAGALREAEAVRQPREPKAPKTLKAPRALKGIRILTPGDRPARTHGHLLLPVGDELTGDELTGAGRARAGSAGAGRAGAGPAGDTLVIVDQFEEIFTLCQDPEERDAFIRLLLTAREPASRLRVLCAVRADFYRHCAEHPDLAEALRDAHLPLPPMTPAELRETIVRPAATAGLLVERELTARLVDTVTGRPGALPLLSHALLETWHRRRGRVLTVAGYEEAGGLDGAVARTAEDLHSALAPARQEALRHLLLRLVAPGADGVPDTRRPLTGGELDALTASADDRNSVELLVRARLATLDDGCLELAHEALLTAWPRLRGWIDEARDRLRVHRALTDAAHAWAALDRDPGALYRGTRLASAEEHLAPGRLTHLERAFLAAGVRARADEQRAAARTARRVTRARGVLAVGAVLALLAGALVWEQDRARDRERVRDEARRVASLADSLRASDPTTSMRLALASHTVADLPETRAALMTAATQKEEGFFTDPDPGADPEARYLLTRDGETLVRIGARQIVTWDVDSHRRTGIYPGVGGLARRSPGIDDGRLVVLAGAPELTLWDVRAGRIRGEVEGSYGGQLGAGGRTVLAQVTDGGRELFRLRAVDSPRTLWQTAPAGGFDSAAVAVSPDDRLVAVCEDGRGIRLWDVRAGRPLPAPWAPRSARYTCGPKSLSFTADGGRLIHRHPDAMRIWDLATGRMIAKNGQPGTRRLQVSEDGRYVVGTGESEILVWRSADQDEPDMRYPLRGESPEELRIDPDKRQVRYLTGRSVRTLSLDGVVAPGPDRPYEQRLLSPDGRTLASARLTRAPGRLRFRLSATPATAGTPATVETPATVGSGGGGARADRTEPCPPVGPAPANCPIAMAFNADGRFFAYGTQSLRSGRTTETFVVVDVRTRRTTATIRRTVEGLAPALSVRGLAFVPGRSSLLVSRERAERAPAEEWDLTTRRPIRSHPGLAGDLYPSRDGRFVMSVTGSRLDLGSGMVTHTPLTHENTTTLAHSPDGRYLASGDGAGRVTLWDASTHRRRAVLPTRAGESSGAVRELAFSPDGRTLAAAQSADTVLLWDLDSFRQLGVPLSSGHDIASLAFGPGSDTLRIAHGGGSVRTYPLAPRRLTVRVCARVGTGLTGEEWRTHLPDIPYRPGCPTPDD
ncbi:nSTAND1 domain-containing NTPase [Streptomyces yaizuensis]|uniref:Helix-turn-helix domain-containing protein n=1 Tax=Streptomyces yaizuensis TaxID=2989713 RepID=A0ABQ5NY87_9ACTN|nr:helix-turn-helix domain-containing protein [Streptomyces sp. YSPA8]GLF95313.1 helix-turn-helix domain-containing protein [Streptomyces sp. YSPA8]